MIKSVEKEYDKFGLCSYKVTFTDDKVIHVPPVDDNRHYQEILEWVANGGTIVDNGS
jgi:hypothetical protein